ncbi:type VII secretion protein EccE [Mycobacterium spongiae]|uniref:Type VII secretion protein EccE n=1 Tax=Mycobacterium spongiae TaxID=886343 RepID=A0A975PVI4_9MYCO|nr:type VII secretion protein EccE [Mycobacterium spongiae]QUR66042.1 type VII secretion protein EccE [Mycobacterium spongiae]
MSLHRSILWPGTGRITLALLAVVPAVMAYPWQSGRDWWVVGIAVVVVAVLFGWWHGLHFTTILRRRLAMMRSQREVSESRTDSRTTALLRVGTGDGGPDSLPLPVIARYLDRYGIRGDTIRVTSRTNGSDECQTWIGLTLSAADNLAALAARSARIPLHETAEVVARRLADHLREMGWEANTAVPEDIPALVAPDARETWRGMRAAETDYVAAYRVTADDELADTFAAIRSHPARETWTVLEIAGDPAGYTVAAACALRTDAEPEVAAPVSGLTPQRGNHRMALTALDPLSAQRLEGHTDAPVTLSPGFAATSQP